MSFLQAHTSDLRVSQAFGARPGGLNPAGGHTGKDIACPVGTPVYAACDGIIEIAGNAGAWNQNRFWIEGSMAGVCVVLNDPAPDGYAFTYNHLSRVNVKVGQRVRRGDIIAWSGNTGASTGPHTHFECLPPRWNFQNGTYGRINPDIVCKAWPSTLDSSGGTTNPAPPANGRWVGREANVLQRSAPNVDASVVRTIPAGTLEIFEGYVHGQSVTVGGLTTDIWYQDKVGYAWSGGFDVQSIAGLPDLTPREKPLEANQRRAGEAGAHQRAEPRLNSDIIRTIPGNQVEVFTGYVHGEVITVNGYTSGVWYVDAKGYVWDGAFTPLTVAGLPDLTMPEPPTPPVPPVEPPAELGPHLNGIDVAQYQESASLNLIAADFYIIKATEGGADWTDSALESNVAEARLSGKPIGFYHYARPLFTEDNTAIEEARSFLKAIAPYLQRGDFCVLDWEAENQHRTDWALEWLRIVQKATGGTPLLYINTKTLNDHAEAWGPVEAEFPLWLASYGTNEPGGYNPRKPAFPVEWAAGFLMWQYTSRGRLEHYSGDLDLNVFYGTQSDLLALGATRILTPPDPNPPIVDPHPPVVDPEEPDTETAEELIREYQEWLLKKFLEERKQV
jgi:GH25 family lysozyme M1 (1,4-beta-N-acetylmuramidase)